MNYIYDILINYQNKLYEVYEWNKEDNITHIRKIPLFRVESRVLLDFISKTVRISAQQLAQIYHRTEKFMRNKTAIIEYSLLVTDGKEVIAFKLDKTGVIKFYSKLLLEEEYEVLEYSSNIPISDFYYEIIGKKETLHFVTREESKIKAYLLREIRLMIQNQNYDKLHYLYLDCFQKEKNINSIIQTILQDLESNWDKVYFPMYEFLTQVGDHENR